jgi:hypothetical protein
MEEFNDKRQKLMTKRNTYYKLVTIGFNFYYDIK